MIKKQLRKKDFQKGAISIVLAVLVLSTISMIVTGMTALTVQQMKAAGQTGQSVIAFYAADSGAERCLYEVRKNGAASCPYTDVSLDFNARVKYTTTYNGSDTITSRGEYINISRKVELIW